MRPENPDLHAHSTCSDGLLTPTELVARAVANGVDLLALTDHDETGGLAEAQAAADAAGLAFVPGVEVSVTWAQETVHIVGLGIDPANTTLLDGLAEVRSGRHARARRMSDALAEIGIANVLEGALKYAANPALVSRAHFARYLVEIGIAPHTDAVFKHYLTRGKPGFVETQWAQLADAIEWILAAGGLPVVAHPGRYKFSDAQFDALFAAFAELGGVGVEVVSGSQAPSKTGKFARYARRFGLLASRASDFHGDRGTRVDLGGCAPLPPDVSPVWDRLTDYY
ncbi:PHP domain-containing protein [Nitrogeniibacter mangrovi]|uniref:PHP domain-containing protein n=1 Tax=Nitrogeniibacter mangrovi TaxID=2016596 RepID=A0A6C1B1U1_9RHOO|nr:3',5'-nucleoside bisphosphate phosphatase [Nitrogeniibacter mangrovi]QID17591.1 PHP domain-containing protein [Nitrogeniibacter mangrovi]